VKKNEIIKIEDNKRFVGYCMINLKTKDFFTLGKINSLVVLDKVKKFKNKKGFIPCEVAYEDIIHVMYNYDGVYSFDKECLDRFITYYEKEDNINRENLEEIKEIKEWLPTDKNDLYTIGSQISDEDSPYEFSLN
jgi:hypothetical protein